MRVSVRWLQLVPAYVVHPRVETVEADVQGYHWTGCRLLEGVPQAVREIEARVDVSLFRREVLRSIVVAREFETPSKENGLPPLSYAANLLRHVLMSVFSRAPSYPQLQNLHLAQGLSVSGSWMCHGHRMAVSGRPGDMLLSRHPLPPLFSPEEAESAQTVATPTRELFTDLKQWEICDWAEEERDKDSEGKEEDEEGSGGTVETFPHLHTLFMVSKSHLWEVQQIQKGLLFLFSRLVEEGVSRYGSGVMREGARLPHPLCGQCVVTDGRSVTLMWLQMSSLNVEGEGEEEGEGGGGNLVAVERLGPLYKDTDMVRGRKKRKVVDFNENTLRTLLATLLMH